MWCVYGAEDTISTLKLTRGRGFWLGIMKYSRANPITATVTFAGAITLNRDADNFFKGYTIVCPPAPLAGASINTPAMIWSGLQDNDELQVPDGFGGYDIAVWNAAKGKWCTYGATDTESTLTYPNGAACWLGTLSSTPSMTFKAN